MSEAYEMVVGLEVHAQLATRTKLFCGCATDGFGAPANTRICPVCTGQPGVLPVLNRRAVELAFKAGLALECKLAGQSIFARKNYFYPDLPKAYQISQYEEPFCVDGRLEIRPKGSDPKTVRLKRIHMEEDAGKLLHAVGSEKLDHSLVDFNRCSTPLIEIVSEPDIRSSEEAYAYLTALKQILRYAGISRCDMEKGEMRCDANISVRPQGQSALGTRVEIKNLNSFKAVKEALEHEFARQAAVAAEGGRVVQETRLWDSQRGQTQVMRSKEEAHDYRYFPDPDLVPLKADASWVSALRAELGELPAARRARLVSQYRVSPYDAEVITSDKALAEYFEAAVKSCGGDDPSSATAKTIANIAGTELLGRLNAEGKEIEQCPVRAEHLGGLARLVEGGTLSSKLAKEVFSRMWETGKAPEELVREAGLEQVSDEGQVREWVKQALAAEPKAADDLRLGKAAAAGRIVGAVMKLSRGKANPALVQRLIKEAV